MSKLDEITLGELGRGVVRYRPYIAVVAAIVMVTAFLPGGDGLGGGGDTAVTATSPGAGTGSGSGSGSDTEAAGETGGTAAVTSATAGGAGGGPGGAGGSGAGAGVPVGEVEGMVANCDPATGRIKIPSRIAPVCVPAFAGDNGGGTYRGVTKDTIKVAVYEIQEDAATTAVLTAAGVNDSREDMRQQYREWTELYQTHFETYGRKIELTFVPASGPSTDDAAAKADAITVADDIGAFASWESANNTYVNELVARGVMCFCTTSQPHEMYLQWAPHVWSTLMSSSQFYVHRAEYVGKRLKGGKAIHAGDPLFTQQERVFGLLYFETDDYAYKAGVDYFEQELRKYGVTLKVRAQYNGYPNVARTQEQARPLIQKLKDAGVTSILCACDPFGPIFFTQEATRQQYRPEWIITGSALTDTSLFGRTYDQSQWSHAFGISALNARLPEEFTEDYRLFNWHYGRGPTAEGRYSVIDAPINIFFNGVHRAGPNLTPETFRDGMFSMPITGQGMVTQASISYGDHGIWPWVDYLAYDDVTEIWWDPSARGEDEVGNDRTPGLYRYVDMGRRYLPTQHPQAPPRVFDPANTVTIFDEPPETDRWPEYPPPNRG